MSFDVQAAIAQAAAQGPDMTKSQSGGGGGYVPPEAGVCLATLVGYIEIGKHLDKSPIYGDKIKEKVQLVFELAGGKNPPKVNEDGTKTPQRITITETLSLNEKANFFKLFRKLNYNGEAKHMSQLLGKHWLVTVVRTEKGEGDDKRIYANLRNDDGYTFRPPVRIEGDPLDPDNSKEVPIAAPERLSDLRLFLWDFASKPMWDSIYIDGSYEEHRDEKTGKVIRPAKSKNVIQAKIQSALNWEGSTMQELLSAGSLDLPETLAPDTSAAAPANAASEDPLAGML